MVKQVKGKCRCCSKEFARAGMLKHLSSCKERKAEAEKETGKKTGYFELLITSRYRKEYWLVIEMEDTAKLKELDWFLRDIWVECCGHCSLFEIEEKTYSDNIQNDNFWGESCQSMNIQMKKIVETGMEFCYEYDFGTTTELIISVKGHREGKKKADKITILSRNNPPEILCSTCQKNIAVWVNPEGFYEDVPYWCETCMEKYTQEDKFDDFEFFLPVCNSPRMGVCGYEGSDIYAD